MRYAPEATRYSGELSQAITRIEGKQSLEHLLDSKAGRDYELGVAINVFLKGCFFKEASYLGNEM